MFEETKRRLSNLFFIGFVVFVFIGGWMGNTYFNTSLIKEKDSPYDFIKEEDVYLENNRVCVNVDWGHWSKFADTNSMDPVIDFGSNAIEITPRSMEDIHVGDIISFKHENDNIIHRVIEKHGNYVITKGDNNPSKDPFNVYFEDITGIVVMVIY